MGLYTHHKATQEKDTVIPCSDMCGVVKQVGKNAPWKVGDRVLSIFNQTHLTGQVTAEDMKYGLGFPLPGVLATYRVFPASGLVKAPGYLSDEEASTLPIASVTAWMAINGMRPMGNNGGAGETILLQGTGGVSIAGLQIAKATGATGMWIFLMGSFSTVELDNVTYCLRACSHYNVVLRRKTCSGEVARCGLLHKLPYPTRMAGRCYGPYQ